MSESPGAVTEQVRERYAAIARAGADASGCCGDGCGCGSSDAVAEPEHDAFGAALYRPEDREAVPGAAVALSLGCGNPTAVAELREGETVLDLGSGGGIDVLLSARRVGPAGHAYGVDMTDEMLERARAAAHAAGAGNVTFLKGRIEDVPLPDASVDVVISNCVVNLSTDKARVFREVSRVLRSGGRIGIADVVAEDRLTPSERAERGDWAGCVAGALSVGEYERELAAAGLVDVEVRLTHPVADGMHSAIVRARRP
jgi:SAM-dependent methyltransferase